MISEAHRTDREPRAAPKATAPAISFRLIAVLLVLLSACRNRHNDSPESLYADAYTSFRDEHYQEALIKTSQGIGRTGPSSEVYWKFRLLNAQILLGKREALSARKALEFELPDKYQTPRNQSRYLLCKGFAASLLRDYEAARAHLDDAAKLASAAGDDELLAEIQNRQGLVAVSQGHFDEAGGLFERARAYASGHNVFWLGIATTGNLGFRLMRQSRYEEAIPYLDQAVAMAHRYGAMESEARNAGNRGSCYYRIGDYDKAIASFRQAETRFQTTGNRSEQEIWLGNIGNIYLARHEYETAAVYYKRALEIARALAVQGEVDAASWLTNLARISIETGDLPAAELYNNEALEIKRRLKLKSAEIYSILNAAIISGERGKFREAEALLREILRSSFDDPTPRLRAHDHLALLLAQTHRDAAAQAEFRSAIAEVESRRNELPKDDYKLAYLSSLIGFYEDFTDFLMNRGLKKEALEVADSSHAGALLQRLRVTRRAEARPHRAAEFQKLAEISGSTLLSYSVGLARSYLWIVTPGAIQSVELPKEAELRPLIEAYDKSIQDLQDPLAKPNPAATQLYRTLIAPAESSVKGRVIVVPDGVLYSLNFETLPVPGPKPHYWIEDATISIAPSLSLLNPDSKAGTAATKSLLLIGNPVSPDPEFPNLAFAAREMTAIQTSLPQAQKTVLSGAAARPGAWAQNNPATFDLIHFAAHATASREEPLESAVILSKEGSTGYRLHAKDVVNTQLNAHLVTISACKSAGARIYAGEGLVGLAWAFLETGAHNVIAGLWNVDDESSPGMMSRLYTGLAAGHGPAESLRDAKLELMRSRGAHRKPYYWGAFQLFTTDARN